MSNEQATSSGQGTVAPEAAGTGNGGRDGRGRFCGGNPGGPGNPFARQVAQLRKALVDAVTVEKVQALAGRLLELAEAGNVQAAKLVFSYVLGKPGAMPESDRLDVEGRHGQDVSGDGRADVAAVCGAAADDGAVHEGHGDE